VSYSTIIAFGGDPPASTLCVLRGLANPNFLLEIEAIAAV
jgi:enamine deaminase RidA (YjgF/YER057c/UK114 family)